MAPRISIWKQTLGMALRSLRRRSHASSCRKRNATSKVAPPQHSSENALLSATEVAGAMLSDGASVRLVPAEGVELQ